MKRSCSSAVFSSLKVETFCFIAVEESFAVLLWRGQCHCLGLNFPLLEDLNYFKVEPCMCALPVDGEDSEPLSDIINRVFVFTD